MTHGPITLAEIHDKATYEARRPDIRRRIMVEKERRRVPLGDHATLNFESHETMLYQVHEMLRAENSWHRPNAAAEELEAYNPLVPGDGALSATLMLEWEDKAERALRLAELVGIHEHLWLQVEGGARVHANFDPMGLDPDKVSAVHYVRFGLAPSDLAALAVEGTVVRVGLDHPAYTKTAVLAEATRAALAADAAPIGDTGNRATF